MRKQCMFAQLQNSPCAILSGSVSGWICANAAEDVRAISIKAATSLNRQ